MGLRAWVGALHIRERYISRIVSELNELGERVHRLEIARSELKERCDLLEGQIESLRARWKGDRGGRPPGPRLVAGDVSSIPRGDKEALRRALLPGHKPKAEE